MVLLRSGVSMVNTQDQLTIYGEVQYCTFGVTNLSVDEVTFWNDDLFASGSSDVITHF